MTPRRGPLRLLSLVVLITLSGSTLAMMLAVRTIVRDQQRRLLHERTIEGGALLTTLFGSVSMTLPVLGAATHPSPGDTAAFSTAAITLLKSGPRAIAAATVTADGVSFISGVGDGPQPGTTASQPRAELARRAVAAHNTVTSVIDDGRGTVLSFAVPMPNGVVLFEDLPIAPHAVYRSSKNDPFNELEGVVYASSKEDPSAIVLATTRSLSVRGDVVRQRLTIGADTWLLVTKSKHVLVGSFAANAPWAVLAAGLLAALLTTGLVETLGRRRTYALALVDERTVALREALEERARLEEAERHARKIAEAANGSKSEFLSRMSHELRTPLNAVLGFAQLLELDELNESQQESVEQILKGGRHLLDLINEVLDISRIETGALALSPEPVLVGDVVGDTLTLMRPLAGDRHVSVSAQPTEAENCHVLADRQRLKQILLNLVANAIKYNREGGSVAVSWEPVAGGRVRIHVDDTGTGIRSDDLDRLFVPFERLGAERTAVEGTGVGLALSRRLAEAMGGTIGVESVHGEGSRFWIELPLAEGPLERYDRLNGARMKSAASDQAASLPRETVLYIEDNLSNVRLVERVLARSSDVDIVPAMQGRLGLELARQHRPAVILLDLHLPDLDGEQVLNALKADPETAGIPVVIVSADATDGQIRRLTAAGAYAYLTKPLDVDRLIAVLAGALSHTAVPARRTERPRAGAAFPTAGGAGSHG